MCDQDALRNLLGEIRAYAQELFADKLHSIILYGSYARGDFDDESDVDVMILVDVDTARIKAYYSVMDHFSSGLSIKYGVLTCILIRSYRQFERYSQFMPFYANVDREGVRISA